MKHYLLGIVALCMAVGFTAFKEISKKTVADVDIYFDGNPLVQDEIEDPANWKQMSPTFTCDGSLKGCKITVDSEDVVPGIPNNTLRTDAEITSTGDEDDGFRPLTVTADTENILTDIIENRD